MTEIHLDPIGGVAGDMLVAALLDLRPDLEAELGQALASLPLLAGVEVSSHRHDDGILTGRRFTVKHGDRPADTGDVHPPRHRHDDAHAHHHHDAPSTAEHHHDHVDWRLIREALTRSALDRATVGHALGIFGKLADAEAHVHGTTPDEVRFHEVGAWDSIADIVAAAWLAARIGATRWTVGALPLGGGRVRTAHGQLPVPAPATARLMEGFLTIDDGIAGERVTPTGAAIVRHLCEPGGRGPSTARVLAGSAHGFGTRRLPGISNCLRVLAFEAAGAASPGRSDTVAVLECEIDDQTGEDLAMAIDALRAHASVLDVVQSCVFGKKGRLMTHVRVQAEPKAEDEIVALIFEQTTTIGVRRSTVRRTTLPRRIGVVDVERREVRAKLVERPSGVTVKIEADDLAGLGSQAERDAHRRAVQGTLNGGDGRP